LDVWVDRLHIENHLDHLPDPSLSVHTKSLQIYHIFYNVRIQGDGSGNHISDM